MEAEAAETVARAKAVEDELRDPDLDPALAELEVQDTTQRVLSYVADHSAIPHNFPPEATPSVLQPAVPLTSTARTPVSVLSTASAFPPQAVPNWNWTAQTVNNWNQPTYAVPPPAYTVDGLPFLDQQPAYRDPALEWKPAVESLHRVPPWIKPDLAARGVKKFTELPEHYLFWKQTFQRVVWNLGLPPEEELTQLVAWLGPAPLRRPKLLLQRMLWTPQQPYRKCGQGSIYAMEHQRRSRKRLC
ncbi:UNVERIFIED_CONTAM: hypothetical protein K2H54_004352 [Gekko kuhli]